jgi:phosphatidylserine/phosphatidylglycerophosphate/cardiolipin synthase-like enzyme
MNRSRAWVLIFFLVLSIGCGLSSDVFNLGKNSGIPVGTSTVSTPKLLNTPLPDNAISKKVVPLLVGYGVHGTWFDLYFTDPTNPIGKQLTGGPDGPLVDAIDSARLSVDAAMYSLSLNSVRDALLHAFRRGVQVHVVMESDNMDSADPQILIEAGIPVLGDRRQGLMHNKFMVIDRMDVWTGSMNFTDSGTYSDNNNLLHIRSEKVAEDYESEFNEMFVDDKFGPDPGVVTPNPRVVIDGTPLDIYFSPDDQVQSALTELLDNAQTSIYFLAYSFTADPLGEAIRNRAEAGVKVSGVMEAGQVASNSGTEYDAFRAAGLDVRLDGNEGQMHHKVLIIDGQIVVTGSYNFSASAENTNDENVVVIYNRDIAGQYLQEFKRVYAQAQP